MYISFESYGGIWFLGLIHRLDLSKYLQLGRDEVCISHLLYADDILIFKNGAESSLTQLVELLRAYERSSGQQISQAKSGFYIHDKYQQCSTVISRVTGPGHGSFPITCPGVSIFHGRAKTVYFEYLVDKVQKLLDGWKTSTLSFRQWITLIKPVLQSYLIYTLTRTLIPKSIIRRMENLIAQFLWNVKGEARTH